MSTDSEISEAAEVRWLTAVENVQVDTDSPLSFNNLLSFINEHLTRVHCSVF